MSGQLEGIGSRTVIETSAEEIAALRGDSAGPPVLLLPGYTGSKEDFAPLFGPLTDAGYAVVSIDLPGQFESPTSSAIRSAGWSRGQRSSRSRTLSHR
jgi:pimeloyl-ACP methyl ester carboxylesterase